MTYAPEKKRHWEKFNFKDWRNDDALNKCSRAARSLWLDICGLIYEANAGGRLLIDGKNPDHNDIAHKLGDHGNTVRKLLAELEMHGVFDRDDAKMVVSRRIYREFLKREKDAANGRLGGNPSLLSKDKPSVGVKAQRLEAREQSPEGLAGLVLRGLRVLGPGAVDHRTDPTPRKSLEALLPDWLNRWDFELDILPVLEAQTRRPRPKPLRFLTRLSEDIAEHHERRLANQPATKPQKSALNRLPDAPAQTPPLQIPDGMAGKAIEAVIARKGATWAHRWLGEVEFNGTRVYAPNDYVRSRLDTEVGREILGAGYEAIVVRGADGDHDGQGA